jgi:hypothetical protein
MLATSEALAFVTMLARTGPPSIVSNLVANRPSTWRRKMSSSESTPMKPSATIDSMSSVSRLRLVSTRSES